MPLIHVTHGYDVSRRGRLIIFWFLNYEFYKNKYLMKTTYGILLIN